jgi:hypothetical protein
LPRRRQGKSQWREPIILVPIIAAVITAIVGPTYAYYYLQIQDQTNDNGATPTQELKPVNTTQQRSVTPTQELKPVNTTQQRSEPGPVSTGNIALETDKRTYGLGDFVRVSGSIDKPGEGKTVRLDVYNPEGTIFQPYNESFGAAGSDMDKWTPAYPRLSDIQVIPNDEGVFYYRFPLDNPVSGSFVKGAYQIVATSGNITGNATFTAR